MATSRDTAKEMRVTLVCQGFNLTALKLQPWRRVYEICRRIASQGVSVTILTDGDIQPQTIGELKIARIGGLTFAPFFRREELKKTILGTNPDVVVWYGSPFSVFYLTFLKLLGKPLIWDIDTDIYSLRLLSRIPVQEMINPINSLYVYFATAVFSQSIMRVVGNSSFISRIIVPNKNLKQVLIKRGIYSGRITIIPSTIEKEMINQTITDAKSELPAKLPLNLNTFLITYFGAPHTFRGPDVAIRSMPKILRQVSNVKLLIFSRRIMKDINPQEQYNRIEEEHLKKLVNKLGVKKYVEIIPGFTEKNLLNKYVELSSVIVFPFRIVPSEPPISVFEAMNLGKAVIVTNIGCLREIVENDRGVLVDSGNACQLANAILFLAKNPKKLTSIGQRAKKFVSTLPDWNTIAQQFKQVIVEVIQEK